MRALHAGPISAIGILVFALLLTAWAVWFFAAEVSVYAVSHTGRLEIEEAAYPVVAPVSGRVVAVHMVLDTDVTADAVLVELDAQPFLLQREEEQARIEGLEARLRALRGEAAAEQQALEDAREAARLAHVEALAVYEEAKTALQLAEQELSRVRHLHGRGHVSEAEFERAQLEAEQLRLVAESRRRTADRMEAERRSQESDRRAMLARLNQGAAVLEEQRTTTEAKLRQLDYEAGRHRVPAPVQGRLAQRRPLREGSVVSTGDTLGVVVRPGLLRAVAYFTPSSAFGRVRSGQKARLRLHGFPWTQYGSLEATVERVASESLSEGVRVELWIRRKDPSSIPLQHGLPCSVEVEVERMSPAMLALRTAGKHLSPRLPM